jgi:hypothetical protein
MGRIALRMLVPATAHPGCRDGTQLDRPGEIREEPCESGADVDDVADHGPDL